ncbi:uncharacterized protein Ecym_7396 [Eremothecium cymbalariae DBVPG|uniref:Uncharacterized protein n=1 Tax=Eremothecium cymbalariae (strain CBS 270.75 / DBVPG 7215 / KCTC 17166 / NRRL Y-17582) TaxID=931890 RepID=G8JWK7_ERECY|nr:hypothetical protein Ecym_7396 [Eremothecium cymbalariae DBVPG\
MFHKSRKVRETKEVDAGAMAAASAIAKAMNSSGTSIDGSMLPRYNSISRGKALPRTVGSGAQSGLVGSPSTRLKSMSNVSRRGGGSKAKLLRRYSECLDTDVQFKEFGGVEVAGVLKEVPQGIHIGGSEQGGRMVAKYIPSPRGLVKVMVPAVSKSSITASSGSLQKPSSLRNGSTSNRQLLQKKLGTIRQGSPLKQSTLTRSSISSNEPASDTNVDCKPSEYHDAMTGSPPSCRKGCQSAAGSHTSPKKTGDKGFENRIAVENIVPYQLDDTSSGTNFKPSESNGKDAGKASPSLLDRAATLEEKIVKAEAEVQRSFVQPHSDEELKMGRNFDQVLDENLYVTPDTPLSHTRSETSPIGTHTTRSAREGNEEPSVNTTKGHSEGASSIEPGVTMAQCLRSTIPYLKSAANFDQVDHKRSSSTNSNSVFESSQVEHSASPHPMKSALKKSSRSGSVNLYDKGTTYNNPAANGAYLSLTTAENTRLNARVSNENLSRKSSSMREAVHKSSIYSGRSQTSEPGKKLPVRKGNRQNNTNLSPIKQEPPARSKSRPVSKKISATKKPTQPKSETPKVESSGLYPIQPPKKSSFERERPQNKNLGFKNLSLRNGTIEDPWMQPDPASSDGRENSGSSQKLKTLPPSVAESSAKQVLLPVTGEGWKSRFTDSDSDEDESPPFSSNSVSTQPSSQRDSPTGHAGFSLFKNHNKSSKQKGSMKSKIATGNSKNNAKASGGQQSGSVASEAKINHLALRRSNEYHSQPRGPSFDISDAPPLPTHMDVKKASPTRKFRVSSVTSRKSATSESKKPGLGGKIKQLFDKKGKGNGKA